MSTTEAQSPFFLKIKHQTKSGKWISVTYCTRCKHRVGSRKIHENLHELQDQGLDLESHHNIIIGKYWEVFDGLRHIQIPWTSLDPMKTLVKIELKIPWTELTAMTAIDREIRNILRPSEADINTDKEQDSRDYYSASEPQDG